MRLLGGLAVVVLAAPTMGIAQSVQMSALVGTWVRPHRGATAVREVLEGKIPIEQILQPPRLERSDTLAPEFRATWAQFEKDMNAADTLVIRPDSTYRWASGAFNRWNYLKGDTLSLSQNGDCVTGATQTTKFGSCDAVCWRPATPEKPAKNGWGSGECFRGEPGYRIVLKDQHLFLLLLDGTTGEEQGIYRRVDTPKPTP